MVHAVCEHARAEQAVPLIQVEVEVADGHLLPARAEALREEARPGDLGRVPLALGDTEGEGAHARFVADHEVEQARVVTAARRDDDVALHRALPALHEGAQHLQDLGLARASFDAVGQALVVEGRLDREAAAVGHDEPRRGRQELDVPDGRQPEGRVAAVEEAVEALRVELEVGEIDDVVEASAHRPGGLVVVDRVGVQPVGLEDCS